MDNQMKLQVELVDLREAIIAVGKTIKTRNIITPLVRLTAKDNTLTIEGDNQIQIKIVLPAEVKQEGQFVATYDAISVLSVRKGVGDVNLSMLSDTQMLVRGKGGKFKNTISCSNSEFGNLYKLENPAKISLPLDTLKELFAETSFAVKDDKSAPLHNILVNIKENDGLTQTTFTATNGVVVAVRNAFSLKEKTTFSGEIKIAPEFLKIALSAIPAGEGNAEILVSDKAMHIEHNGYEVTLPVWGETYPDVARIVQMKENVSFKAVIKKDELLESLDTAIHLQRTTEKGLDVSGTVVLHFENDKLTVTLHGNSDYLEELDATIDGELPEDIYFNPVKLKEVVNYYPADDLIIAGTTNKAPVWLTMGENEEYIYCILPINPKAAASAAAA